MAGRISLGANGSMAVAPGDTPVLTAVIEDENGDPVTATDLASLTLSIIDTASGAVVNGADAVDILNTGRGTVDADGNLTVTLTAADTALAAGDGRALRSLVFAWTYNEGAAAGRYQVDFVIRALSA